MALADHAKKPVRVLYQGNALPVTCHVATLYWAALEARGVMAGGAHDLTILQNVVGAGNLYAILEGLRFAGTWDFGITPATPPIGSVLLWTGQANHSAVVIAQNLIAGHNQDHQFDDVANADYCMKHVQKVKATTSLVRVIPDTVVVAAATNLNL